MRQHWPRLCLLLETPTLYPDPGLKFPGRWHSRYGSSLPCQGNVGDLEHVLGDDYCSLPGDLIPEDATLL
jgi:hypothetical protein